LIPPEAKNRQWLAADPEFRYVSLLAASPLEKLQQKHNDGDFYASERLEGRG
jgi:hypothetical protein